MSLNDVCLSYLSRPAFYDQTRMPLGPRPSLNDVCLLCLSRQVFCDQTHMPLDLDTRSRTIALAVSLCFAVLVLRFDDTRFPLPLLTQIYTLVAQGPRRMTGSAASCNEAKLYVYFPLVGQPLSWQVASADFNLARFHNFDSRAAF